ncbi:MAG: response regulator transcription factor [Planctomycetota bacterium]|nr:response regulator transcription factor [Planctomycetota bacterium]
MNAPNPSPKTGPAPRVLVVDNNRITRLMIQDLLLRARYDVLGAENGIEAWNLLVAPYEAAPSSHEPESGPRPFDLLICDWAMPEMDGIELVKRLRAHPQLRTTIVLMVTGHSNTDDLVQGLDGGADEYMTKPFKTEELLARVNAGLRLRRLQEEIGDLQHHLAAAHLATTAAHEINNPLMILTGNLELMWKKLEALNDPEVSRRLEAIWKATERIQKVVQGLRYMKEIKLKPYANQVQMLDLDLDPQPAGALARGPALVGAMKE